MLPTTSAKAREALGWLDFAVLRVVLLEGRSLERAAEHLLPGTTAHQERKHLGHRLRMALLTLADIWFPSPRRRHAHAWRPPDAVPHGVTTGTLEMPIEAVHASRRVSVDEHHRSAVLQLKAHGDWHASKPPCVPTIDARAAANARS